MINHSAAKEKILEYLTTKAETIPELGVILPTPLVFAGRAAYFAGVSGLSLTTQKTIETTPIKFCAISILIPFEDENPITEGCQDAPKTTVTFTFAVFRQYEEKRVDEADGFLKRQLTSSREFHRGIDSLYVEFNGKDVIPNIGENLIISLAGLEPGIVENREPSKHFTGELVFGHQIDLQLRVDILPIKDGE